MGRRGGGGGGAGDGRRGGLWQVGEKQEAFCRFPAGRVESRVHGGKDSARAKGGGGGEGGGGGGEPVRSGWSPATSALQRKLDAVFHSCKRDQQDWRGSRIERARDRGPDAAPALVDYIRSAIPRLPRPHPPGSTRRGPPPWEEGQDFRFGGKVRFRKSGSAWVTISTCRPR